MAFLRRGAKTVLVWLINFAVLFAILNIAIAFFTKPVVPPTAAELRRESSDAAIAKYGIDYFKRLYPDKSEAQIRQLISDQAELPPAIYEPYAEYRAPAITSPTLNVHEAGFRLNGADQAPWPLDPKALNIFVFGGSEITGAGVEDDETIPATLQKLLRQRTGKSSVNVYNFAVQAYNSSQDVTYFQNQLRYGNIPDIAIFMEGPVDFERWNGETTVSYIYRDHLGMIYKLMDEMGEDKGFIWHSKALVMSLPIVTFVQQRYSQADTPTAPAAQPASQMASQAPAANKPTSPDEIYARQYTDGPDVTSAEHLSEAITHLLTNKGLEEGISRQFDVEPMTVLVPSALYKYDINYMPPNITDIVRRERYGYPILAEYIQKHDMGNSFLSCADIQEGVHEQLYVDQAHYSKAGNLLVAGCVADRLIASGALDRAWSRKSTAHEPLLRSVNELAQAVGNSKSVAAKADGNAASPTHQDNKSR